ncbi:MAG TPA: DUF4349 domain-containing protein [Ferruginibacter sp.]|nr:DUF4349 domain-containing protein [Ferruginibacter sp.]HRO17503.1 DUF4349 domain-containing protein [Ferruginibacter sp.]HRQ20244.1 DUF4349 domain-containing protein [Ferruginibacter sp.]
MRKIFLLLLSTVYLFACNSYQSNDAEKTSYAASAAAEESYTGDSVKLVRTANLQMKVQQVEKTAPEISTLTKKLGGMVMLYQLHASEDYSTSVPYSDDSMRVITRYTPQANMEVRIPTHQLDTFLFTVAKLGYYTRNSNMQVDDRSLSYLRNVRKQQVRTNAVESQLHQKRSTNDMVKNIQVQDEMIDQQIDNKSIDYDVLFSVVKIDLFQNALLREEVTIRANLSSYTAPFSYKMKQAFLSGWSHFQQLIIAITHLWMLIILFPLVYVLVKWMRKKIQWNTK